MNVMFLNDAVLFNVPKILDQRGNLSFFQYPDQIPFEIKRVYWINYIPGGTDIAGQANKESMEIIIALSGSFDVLVDDGKEEKKFTLNQPDTCLYIPKMVWRQLVNFSTNSVSFVVSDKVYDEANSIVDFLQFKLIKPYATPL